MKRCFKCNGFNHKSTECKNKQACLKCGEDHNVKECKSNEYKCVNCDITNKKFKTNFKIDHKAHSAQCPIYNKKLEIERKQILYTI